jgi:hypothetical protein
LLASVRCGIVPELFKEFSLRGFASNGVAFVVQGRWTSLARGTMLGPGWLFADDERPAKEVLPVACRYGAFGNRVVHFHNSESARLPGEPVDRDIHRAGIETGSFKPVAQLRLVYVMRQVADV